MGRPERLDLKSILWHFLHFRLEVVTNRLEHELEALHKRIHVLEGFEKVFDALDEIIRIIRKSDGKADAAEKIIKRFELDAEQADAILELKLYRLARLEILVIQNELADKRKRARQITGLLKDEEGRWGLVRADLDDIQAKYAQGRQAAHAHRGVRRRRVHRRRLHRRGGQRRHRVARRLAEAAEGSARPLHHAIARGRFGAGRAAGQHARQRGVLHQSRRRLHLAHHRRAGIHRLRRAGAEAVQAARRRAGRGGLQPRPARGRADHAAAEEGQGGRLGRAAAGPRDRGHVGRLRAAFQLRAVPRAEHPRGPALRAAGRRRRSGGRGADRPARKR